MVNFLEFLYVVTAVSLAAAVGLAVAGTHATEAGRARRRRARVCAIVAAVAGSLSAGVYWTLS
jgi:hypothetical protein